MDTSKEGQPSSYTKVTANNSTWSLELHLFREDNGADFSIGDYGVVARLAYSRLHLPEGGMILLLSSWYRAFKVNSK